MCYSNATTTTARLRSRSHLSGRRHQVPRPATTAALCSVCTHCDHYHANDEGDRVEVVYRPAAPHRCARHGTTTASEGGHDLFTATGRIAVSVTQVLSRANWRRITNQFTQDQHAMQPSLLDGTCRFWYARGGCELIATRPAPLMPTLYPMHTTCTSQLPACS